MVTTLTAGIGYGDLQFQGLPRIIASAFLQGPDGIAIVDPGPTSTLPALVGHLESLGAGLNDVSALLVTHIHLDHSGAAGVIVRQNPKVRVFVHTAGAPHLVDPSKLVASAGRLYGDQMERLWGEVAPVAPGAVVALDGAGRITAGGRTLEVAYTPGHASHHVSYFCADAGLAFVGDTAGVQVTPGGFVLPPTPPPDIDLPQWLDSLEVIERWQPQTLFLTHFGPSEAPGAHLAELRANIGLVERLAREASQLPDEAEREPWFVDQVKKQVRQKIGEAEMRLYEVAGRFDLNWRGLARYLSRRARS